MEKISLPAWGMDIVLKNNDLPLTPKGELHYFCLHININSNLNSPLGVGGSLVPL